MERYKGFSDKRELVSIKIGGRFFQNREMLKCFADEIKALENRYVFFIIHGGGNEVTELSKRLGMEPVFKDGVRITSWDEMEIVEGVLAGSVNKRIVRTLRASGVDAVGLSGADGSIFLGETLGNVDNIETRTGRILKTNTRLLEILADEGYTPVISSTSSDLNGEALNINADTVAFHISKGLIVDDLIFISDVEGIIKEGEIVPKIPVNQIEQDISNHVITGGMIPKVRASVDAIESGIGKIVIGTYSQRGDLERLIEGKKGTIIAME